MLEKRKFIRASRCTPYIDTTVLGCLELWHSARHHLRIWELTVSGSRFGRRTQCGDFHSDLLLRRKHPAVQRSSRLVHNKKLSPGSMQCSFMCIPLFLSLPGYLTKPDIIMPARNEHELMYFPCCCYSTPHHQRDNLIRFRPLLLTS